MYANRSWDNREVSLMKKEKRDSADVPTAVSPRHLAILLGRHGFRVCISKYLGRYPTSTETSKCAEEVRRLREKVKINAPRNGSWQ